MSTELKYIPFGGGLNMLDSQITMKDGFVTDCFNFEQIFGQQGYSRIHGFERLDGHQEPHTATYWIQPFDQGTATISVGNIVTGPSATGEVLAVVLESGAWDGTAAGYLVLGSVTGTWADNAAISVTTQKATASAATYAGSSADTHYTAYRTLAADDARAAISAVPGSGGILGIGIANGTIYAARNAADGLSAALYKATASGWTAVRTGLYPGGRFRMIQANFTGSTANLYLFGCDGKNRSFQYDGTTFTLMAPIYGSQGTSTSVNTIGTGAKTFTIVQATRSWTAGQSLIIWSTANAANRMTGTVTSYTSGTNSLVMNITSINGSGTLTDWEIGLASFTDKPFMLKDHANHLFLAYPYGQLQTSNINDPMTYTSTATLFGMSQEITGLIPLKGGVLAIYCTDKVELLSGTGLSTWSKAVNSTSSGAVRYTTQEIASNGLGLDDRGLTSLQATLVFGSFEMSVFSRYVKPYLDTMKPYIVDSTVVKAKNQYRLYASNGIVLSCTILSPNALIQPADVAFTRSAYGVNITCATSGEINSEEYILFGTDDGYVMREGVGTSFDGNAIDGVLRLPFNSFKSPSHKKRFRKMILELDAPQTTTISFRDYFDYSDGTYNQSTATALGGGGKWDASDWDTFRWSLPDQTTAEANISGVGRNMGMLIWHSSDSDDPFTLQGMIIHYSVMGLAR